MNEVMIIIKQLNCSVQQQDMNLFCHLLIGIPKGRLNEALYRLNEIRNVEVEKAGL